MAAAEAEHQVERRLLLDIVVSKSTIVLQLLACKDEALLIRWSPDLPQVSKWGGLYLKPYQVC